MSAIQQSTHEVDVQLAQATTDADHFRLALNDTKSLIDQQNIIINAKKAQLERLIQEKKDVIAETAQLKDRYEATKKESASIKQRISEEQKSRDENHLRVAGLREALNFELSELTQQSTSLGMMRVPSSPVTNLRRATSSTDWPERSDRKEGGQTKIEKKQREHKEEGERVE